jgi:predicted transcriptional regulator YdeE
MGGGEMLTFDRSVFCVMLTCTTVTFLSNFTFAQKPQGNPDSVEQDTIVRGVEMETRISTRRAMKVAGLVLPEKMEPYVLQLWIKLNTKIASIPNQVNPHVLYGIYKGERVGDKVHYTYMVGIEVKEAQVLPEGVSLWEIPSSECAVFSPRGHIGNVVQMYKHIRVWFQTSEYEPRDEGYILEVYNTQQELNENYVIEMWKELK